MKYSVVKRINGQPDIELCIEATSRDDAKSKAQLYDGQTISITRWVEE